MSNDTRTPTYSPAVHAAARAWADSMPSQTGGFDAIARHRQNQLLVRMDHAIRAASIFLAGKAEKPEGTQPGCTETETNQALTKRQAEAAELYPMPLDGDATANACAYAARHAHIAALAARDAEATTVSAEQVESAAKAAYEERTDTLWEAADAEDQHIECEDMRTGFRAAGFQIEGDPR